MGLSVYEDHGEIDARFLYEHCWSGAKDRVNDLSDSDLEIILDTLAEEYPDGMELTELNDFLWFEDDTYAEWLGYPSADAMYRGQHFEVDDLYVDEVDEDEDGNPIFRICEGESGNEFDMDFATEDEAEDYIKEHKADFTDDDFDL